MRAKPSQIAVQLICGEWVPFSTSETVQDRIKEGHDFLVRITDKDFGYDLQAWHDYLKESRQGGYTYGRNIVLPKVMQTALESDEWKSAVDHLTRSSR